MLRWTTRRGLFEASDATCSALCCNCFQFSCCHPPEIKVKTIVEVETNTMLNAGAYGQETPPIRAFINRTFSQEEEEEEEEAEAEGTTPGTSGSRRQRKVRPLKFSNWMRDLVQIDDSIRVRDLILVGSHNASSYTISAMQPFSAVARTQSYTILQQLQAGTRFLDLRIASSEEGNDVSIWHGCVAGAKFYKVLDEIRLFITEHPEELIILHIVPELGKFFTSAQRLHALDLIQQTLIHSQPSNVDDAASKVKREDEQHHEEQLVVNHLFPGDHLLDMLQHWTLRDLYEKMGRTQRVVVLIHDRFFQQLHDTTPCKNIHNNFARQSPHQQRPLYVGRLLTVSDIQSKYGYCRAETYMRNLWHNTRNLKELLASALVDVQRHGSPTPALNTATFCQFHVSQLVATPGVGSTWDVVRTLIGRNSLRPISWAYRLYQKDGLPSTAWGLGQASYKEDEEDSLCILDNFLRANIYQPWNVFLLDYVDQCPWTLQFLTALNFPVQLTIQMATYRVDSHQPRSLDITELVQSFVHRHRVLYLTNIIRDLNLSNTLGGTLTIAYQLSSFASIRSTTATPFSSPPANTTSLSQSTSWSSSSSLEMDPQVIHHSGTSGYFASRDSEDTNASNDDDDNDRSADNIPKKKSKTMIHSHFVLTFRIKNSMLEAEFSLPSFYFMLMLSHFGCFCTPEMRNTIKIVKIPPSAHSGHVYHGRLVLGNNDSNVSHNEELDNVWLPSVNDSTVLKFTTKRCNNNRPDVEFQVIH